MLVMVTGTFPLNIRKKVIEAHMKSMEEPMSHVKNIGSWTCLGGEGINYWYVYELEKGHEKEGLKELAKAEVHFQDIEG